MKVGSHYLGAERCEFIVWAPFAGKVTLRIVFPQEREIPMEKGERGYWNVLADKVGPGTRYMYRLDGSRDRPDPASCFQPEGVHGPSEVVDHHGFKWEDDCWRGVALSRMIIYELHVGAFSPEGTLEAIIPRLEELKDLGINALEIMALCQFPGIRNWGYDGVCPFAVQNSYGGPEGLKKLVNECHRLQIAVILDVVYNHLGPEGCYLTEFGPYLTDKYATPWGKAVNFDDAYCDEVRDFFVESALRWLRNYHIDGLRLDAVHAVYDFSARPFLCELAVRTSEFSVQEGRRVVLIAESDLNDSKVVRARELGGYGTDAQWCDDFHHALHAVLTGDRTGYYVDFGEIEHLAKSYERGFTYSGQHSLYRNRRFGNSSRDIPADRFVVFCQNHDQVGNRAQGERLSVLVPFEALKLAAGAVLFSPYIPLLFMGEEYGEDAPFLYFVGHTDRALAEAVREGRAQMFRDLEVRGEVPDPLETETFLRSRIDWQKRERGRHRVLLEFYREVIRLRKAIPALSHLDKESLAVSFSERERTFSVRRWHNTSQTCCVMNFNGSDTSFIVDLPAGKWKRLMDSSEKKWGGQGPLLPEEVGPFPRVTMRGWSIALFSRAG